MSSQPTSFAGLPLDRPLVMGVVNVTPDSFSDGGEAFDTDSAITRGRALAAAGADILDVGGESTRPGAEPVSEDEEASRVLPVIEALASEGFTVSADTRRASVMQAALDAGAHIINDVTALAGDEGSLDVVAASSASVVLMHMQGDPGTMQDAPAYDDVVAEVYHYLENRVAACLAAGLGHECLAVDPGIGFGKTADHNLELLKHLHEFTKLGCAVVLGVSRKSFIGAVSGTDNPKDRLAGSLAAGLAGVGRGAHILRVHDVAETRQALDVWKAIESFEKK